MSVDRSFAQVCFCGTYYGGLHDCDDEVLVFLAREAGCQAARDELLLRYDLWRKQLVAHFAHAARLPRDELPDAQQQAVFAVIEAIDQSPLVSPAGRRFSFRRFAFRVVRLRFFDFLRAYHRRERRSGRGWAGFGPPAGGAGSGQSPLAGPDIPGKSSDPLEHLIAWEERHLLERAWRLIPEADRRLLECVASGVLVRTLAVRLRVPYWKMRRLVRHRVLALRALVHGTRSG
jgi:DNA-directed RNA polymerase specialized sigma24 family protein